MTYRKILLSVILAFIYLASSGQVGVAYDLVKPKKFENRVLASEKSNDGKKFHKSRRFIQNTITHYNYYFNANEKLKMIMERAKGQFRDDYTHLLPFYNYTLEATVAQKRELDSIIYKCTAGILIHDTRNDWIDNLYLLIGKAYYLRKDFDSAYITLQFLNYAFSPKESDGYDKPIGSNANAEEGGSANIVSTIEKRNILQKTFSLPPSRNEALVWKVRTYIGKEQFNEASALIEVLSLDPQFPVRLQPSLNEVKALWYYKRSIYDSAAVYLEKALPAAENHEERARWEYLIAQLYERVDRSFESKTFYERAITHTYDPILEIYARLNAIRQTKDGSEDFIAHNIEALVRMAHRDRYESYRDIIYYTAAQMELERNNKAGAESFLLQSVRYASINNNIQRNRSFLQLANLTFEEKKYKPAKNYYDSVNIADPLALGDISWLPERKAALAIIVAQMNVMERQDSLQRIAALPIPQRDAYIKKLVRTLRRQQGLRDETDSSLSNNPLNNNNTAAVPDLFKSSASSADWYFNNQSLKAKGYSDFKNKWGNRPNVDNWQMASIMKTGQLAKAGQRNPADLQALNGQNQGAAPGTIDFKSLLSHLPLTEETMKKSMDSIENALFILGKTYQEGIPDYLSAIHSYDSLLGKFPETRHEEEALLGSYYCYKKLGDEDNAARMLALLKQRHPKGALTARAVNPDSTLQAAGSLKVNATHQYEKIYLSFIEGRFDEALAEKKVADSLYGDKYWTPQLLYIESVYFIRSRQDPQAKATLMNIQAKWPKTPMAAKAATLLDVLNRRKQIEDYLTQLQVTRAKDDDSIVVDKTNPTTAANDKPRLVRNDSNMLVKEDTSQLARAHLPTTPGVQGQKPAAARPGVNMDKLQVDTAGMRKIAMSANELTQLRRLQDSLQAAMFKAQADSAQTALIRYKTDSINAVMQKLRADTAQLAAKLRTLNSVFSLSPDKPHSVLILLDKVDPVYVNETKNAFSRFNAEEFFSLSLTTDNAVLTDSLKMVAIGSFASANDALDYLQKIKALAPRQIVPWLPANKYSFVIISATNLELLQSNKDLPAYRKFLQAAYPAQNWR